jgi:mRNA-degrading endonuclease RelE of RelBE toxin-antitoxin system
MWKVEYTKRFLKELSKLPNEVQVQAEKLVFEELLSANPFILGYLKHMTGYPDKYKSELETTELGSQ